MRSIVFIASIGLLLVTACHSTQDMSPRAINEDLGVFGAVTIGDLEMVREFISSGVDVNARRRFDGKTLFHVAVCYGNCLEHVKMDVVRFLADEGADLTATDMHGNTPLHDAVGTNWLEVVKFLLERGVDPDIRDGTGETPLHWCAMYYPGYEERLEIARLLLSKGADPNARNKNGATPVHIAAEWGHTTILNLLIENGGDINAEDSKGCTTLDRAIEGIFADDDFVEMLRKHDAKTGKELQEGK